MLCRTPRLAALSAAAFSVLTTLSAHRAHAVGNFIFWSGPGTDWTAANWGGTFSFTTTADDSGNGVLFYFNNGTGNPYNPTITSSIGAPAIWFGSGTNHTIAGTPGATLTLGYVNNYSFYDNFSLLADGNATGSITLPVIAKSNLYIEARDTSSISLSGGLSGTGSLNITGSSSTSISSTANWTGSLNLTGGGTLYLAPNQNISGPYNVSNGTLAITDPSALGSAPLNLGSAGATGTLAINSASPVTLAKNINASGSFDGLNYAGGGAIQNDAPSLNLTGAIQIGTPGTAGQLAIAGAGQTTLSGTISTSTAGVGYYARSRILKTGAGTLTITGDNDATFGVSPLPPTSDGYATAGDLRIDAGTVQLRNGHAIGDSAMIKIRSGGTLDLGADNETIGSLSDADSANIGGSVQLGSATLTLTGASTRANFGGVISGAGGLAVNMPDPNSVQVLSGFNAYTGHTIISNGTLLAGANVLKTGAGPLGNDGLSYVTVGDANTTSGAFVGVYGDNVNFAKDIHFTAGPDRTRGIVGYTSNSVISGDLTLAGSDILINPTYSPGSFDEGLTLTGNMTGAGGLVIDSSALGNVILSGNAATAASARNLTIVGGNLVLVSNVPAGPSPIALGTADSTSKNPGLYARGNITVARDVSLGSNDTTIGGAGDSSATFSGSIALNGHTLSLYSQTTGSNATTFAGPITGSGSLMVEGQGTVLLTGNNSFQRAAGTPAGIWIDSGTLRFNTDANLGAVPTAPSSDYIVLAGGTLAPNQSLTLDAKRGITLADDSTLQLDAGITLSYAGTISGGSFNHLTKSGNGTLALNAATVTTNFTNAAGTTNFTGGSLTGNFTNSGGITTFDSTSSYTGTMTLSGGITRLPSTANLSTGKLAVSGGVLETSGSLTRALGTGNNQLAWTSGGFSAVGGDLTLNIGGAGARQVWGTTTNFLGNSSTMTLGSANATGTVTLVNAIQLTTSSANATRTIQVDRGTGTAPEAVLSGVLSDISTRTGSLLKTGAGALVLSNANTFRGTTTLRNGSLYIGASDTTGSAGALGTSASALTVGDASTTSSNDLAFGVYGADASTNRAITVANKGNSVTLGVFSANNATFSGNVTLGKTTNLTALTGGSATFSGTLSSTGGITKTGAGAVSLTGTNSFSGNTTVQQGTLALGSAGSLASPKITVNSGATLDVTAKGTAGLTLNASQILLGAGSVLGNLTVNANASVGGTLNVSGSIGGAGSVNPGNSPGILTASSIAPAGGLDFSFEFSQPGSPNYATPAASGNDVLHLTSPSTPFASALTADNAIDLYLPTLTADATFRGGFYTDLAANFLASIQNATFHYFTLDPAGSTLYNGNHYSSVNAAAWLLSLTTIADPASFDGSTTTNGYVTQISAHSTAGTPVPLPSSAAMGLALLPLAALHRRLRRTRIG